MQIFLSEREIKIVQNHTGIKLEILPNKLVARYLTDQILWHEEGLTIEPAHKPKIDKKKLQNCKPSILNLVNVL